MAYWTVQYANVNLSHHVQVQKLIGHLDPNIGHKLDKLDIWTNLPTLIIIVVILNIICNEKKQGAVDTMDSLPKKKAIYNSGN